MDERPMKYVPRMRTAPKIVAEIKAMDPGSEVTEHSLCQATCKRRQGARGMGRK